MLLQTILQVSIYVFLSSRQFCEVKGQCVDQTGVIQNGKTCAQLAIGDCYDATFLSKCCQSCKAFYTGVTGCEYGDKVADCIVDLCQIYTNRNECCNTCKVTTAAPTPSPSTTTTPNPTLATTATATTPAPTLTTTTPSTPFIATTTSTTQPTITTTPNLTIAAATATTSKTTATVTPYPSTTTSSQVPAAPSVSVVSQTTKNITLNITLQAGGTANEFEINASTGVAQKIPLPAGNVSVEYVFSAPNDSGTCFKLEIVAINAAGRSAVANVSNACYAPLPPLVTTVAQTATNVTLNLTLPQGSLGNTFEVKVTGAGTNQSVFLSLGGSRSIQYVLDPSAEAGSCFLIEVITIVTNNPIKSQATIASYVCYAPKNPEVTVVTQTTGNVTLTITLPVGSLGNNFEVKAIGGGTVRSVSIAVGGSRSVQYVIDIAAEAGTCFILEAVTLVTKNSIASDKTTFSNACYAPKRPDVSVANQTTNTITLIITLPTGSLGNNFEVNVQGGGTTQSVPLTLGTSRSVQHVLKEMADAGTCFNLEVVTRVTNNLIKSDKTTVSNACYAPKSPDVSVANQTTNNITLIITLPTGSLGNNFEVNAQGGGTTQSVPLTLGTSRSVQHVLKEMADAGTCFNLEIVTRVTNNLIKSDKTTVSNACYAPKSPDVSVANQTTNNITLIITLPTGSLGNNFEVNAQGGGTTQSVPLTLGTSRSVQHVLKEMADAGTCFNLEIVTSVANNPIKSDKTTVSNACYAPQKPEVNLITQTTSNVTMNITLSTGSLGNTFEVNVTGGGTSRSMSLSLLGSRSIQHVLNEVADAGTCFKLDIVTLVTNNPIKSDTATFTNACYAPKSPKITVVTQTTSNVTLNIMLPVASLGSTFEVNVTGGGIVRYVSLPVGGSRSVQYVFNEMVEAGTCFSLVIVNLVINNPIKSDKTDFTSACYAPKKPEVNVITQTTSTVTLNITLPTLSLGNTFEIKVTGGGAFRSVPFTTGVSRSLQHVFNELAEAGTCFGLEFVIVVTTNPIKSDTTTLTNACYAPSKPQVDVVAQTTMNITMNITLPTGSLGNSFEVRVTGGATYRSVPLNVGGSRSVQHVFNDVAKAGTCFRIEIVTLVNSNPIKSDTTITSSCYVPFKPTGSVVEQTMNYITFNIALQAGSTGKSFNVKVIGGKEYDLGIPEGSTDVEFVFNETGIPGTCFTLQVKTMSVGNVTQSEASSIPNTCYAPKRPHVYVVETTIKNIKLNISIASDGLAKSFQIRRTGDAAKTVDLPPGTTSALYVFDSKAEAGTCFTFEIVAIAADDRARSNVFVINSTCYASFPVQPGSLSAEEKMIVAVSSVGGLIFVCCAAAVFCIIVMKMKKALQNKTYSPPRRHGNHRLRSHHYGNPRNIPDYFGTNYPTPIHSYNYQRYNLYPMTNNENFQDYITNFSQFYNWGQLTPLKTFKTYR